MFFGKKFYFDDPEGDALDPKTSHPNFVKNMTEEFYYDCTDDFSPFGNDDGSDLLYSLEEWYQEGKGKGNILKWLFQTIDGYGCKYASEGCSQILDEAQLQQVKEEDPYLFEMMDRSIIAAAFGQYKITGQIAKQLKELALIALKRQLILNGTDTDTITIEYASRLKTMQEDLEKVE